MTQPSNSGDTIDAGFRVVVPPRGRGAETTYTKELGDELCTWIADGGSLRGWCERDGYPDKETVRRWLRTFPDFLAQYRQARDDQIETFVDDVIQISDDGHNDWMERHFGRDTAWVVNGEAVGRSKLRIWTRMWIAERMKPKKYGNKVEQTHKIDNSAQFLDMLKAISSGQAEPAATALQAEAAPA